MPHSASTPRRSWNWGSRSVSSAGGVLGPGVAAPVCTQQDFWSAASRSGRALPSGRHLTGISEPGTEVRTGRSAQPPGVLASGAAAENARGLSPRPRRRLGPGKAVPGDKAAFEGALLWNPEAFCRDEAGDPDEVAVVLGPRPSHGIGDAAGTSGPWQSGSSSWAPRAAASFAFARPLSGCSGSPGGPGRTLARERERSFLSPLPGALPWFKAGRGAFAVSAQKDLGSEKGPQKRF